MQLNATEQMAVAKAIADKAAKAAREEIQPGLRIVDFYLHVHGDLAIAQDTEKTPTVSIPLYATLAIALKKAGVQAENILSIIESSVSEAIANDTKVNDGISEQVEQICDHLKTRFAETLPKTPVRGAVKANLVVEKIEAADLLLAQAA
jgi:hypothetical protein